MTSFEKYLKDNERVDYLFREKIHLIQSPSFFTFSLDALLLADFIDLPNRPFKYIDFCSGNGIIPILLSHRTDQRLEGIELQSELVDMANRSLIINNLTDRIHFIQGDLREFKRPVDVLYDIVSCNPPYFLVSNSSHIHTIDSHAIARHELYLTMKDWVAKARQILKTKGKLFIVHRPDRLDDLFEVLLEYQFSVNRLKFVYPRKGSNANVVLIEAIYLGGRQGVKVEAPFYVHTDDGSYTLEAKALYYGDK